MCPFYFAQSGYDMWEIVSFYGAAGQVTEKRNFIVIVDSLSQRK